MRILLLSLALLTFSSAWATDILCPVLREPVVANSVVVDFNGIQVRFCCPGCETQFRAKPGSYLADAILDEKVVGVFAFDPISKQKITPGEGKPTSDYNGVRYYFSSDSNKQAFDAKPAQYANIPASMSLTCPVMKNPVALPGRASGYDDYKGVRYYFCCAGCEKTFAEDPAKYSAEVAEKVVMAGLLSQKAGGGLNLAPTCAGCAGEAKVLGANGLPTQWTFSARFIASDIVAARARFTLDYRLTNNLTIGIERTGGDAQTMPTPGIDSGLFNYLAKSDGDAALLPRASWFITPETRTTPSVVTGFTSDRLSTPRGQAFFTTFSKKIEGQPLTPFVSVKYNTFDGAVAFPFGMNWRIDKDYAFQLVNDGKNFHWLVTKLGSPVTVSLLLARSRELGFSFNVGF